jgi:glycosyltransferase involved in cell wall biosynthesis
MHVAHFIQRYPPALGGAEAYFARLGRFLHERGAHVTVFTTTALDLEAFWSPRAAALPPGRSDLDGIAIHRFALDHWPGRRYVLKALSLLPWRPLQALALPCNPISRAMKAAADEWPHTLDVVHASALPYTWPLWCGLRLARRRGVPFLVTPFLHVGDPDDPRDATRRAYTRPGLRWLLRQADVLFAQTELERAALVAVGVAPERVILQGLGVDAAECTGGDRTAARRRWGCAGEEVVIGHLANNSREKGTVDLLGAFERLAPTDAPCRLVLAGPEMPNFRHFWQDWSNRQPPALVQRVVRLGVLSDQDRRDFFAGLDVFALPSRSDSFGLVLLEAWANGLPNVAYRAGGVTEVVRHETDGLLVRCGDVAVLADSLRALAADAAWRQRLGAAGRWRALHELRWEDRLDIVRSVCREAVAGAIAEPSPVV